MLLRRELESCTPQTIKMVSDHSNFILKHRLGYSKKTRMPVFDLYSAQKEAEDHTTSHSGYVETADEAFEREKASIKCCEENWEDWDGIFTSPLFP